MKTLWSCFNIDRLLLRIQTVYFHNVTYLKVSSSFSSYSSSFSIFPFLFISFYYHCERNFWIMRNKWNVKRVALHQTYQVCGCIYCRSASNHNCGLISISFLCFYHYQNLGDKQRKIKIIYHRHLSVQRTRCVLKCLKEWTKKLCMRRQANGRKIEM